MAEEQVRISFQVVDAGAAASAVQSVAGAVDGASRSQTQALRTTNDLAKSVNRFREGTTKLTFAASGLAGAFGSTNAAGAKLIQGLSGVAGAAASGALAFGPLGAAVLGLGAALPSVIGLLDGLSDAQKRASETAVEYAGRIGELAKRFEEQHRAEALLSRLHAGTAGLAQQEAFAAEIGQQRIEVLRRLREEVLALTIDNADNERVERQLIDASIQGAEAVRALTIELNQQGIIAGGLDGTLSGVTDRLRGLGEESRRALADVQAARGGGEFVGPTLEQAGRGVGRGRGGGGRRAATVEGIRKKEGKLGPEAGLTPEDLALDKAQEQLAAAKIAREERVNAALRNFSDERKTISEQEQAVIQAKAEATQKGAELLVGAGAALISGGKKQLNAFLKNTAKEETIRGFSQLALGIGNSIFNPPAAAAHFSASATHFATAALAGGGAAATQGGGRGRGGGGGRQATPQSSGTGAGGGQPANITVNINSPVAEQQIGRLMNTTSREARRRYGDAA